MCCRWTPTELHSCCSNTIRSRRGVNDYGIPAAGVRTQTTCGINIVKYNTNKRPSSFGFVRSEPTTTLNVRNVIAGGVSFFSKLVRFFYSFTIFAVRVDGRRRDDTSLERGSVRRGHYRRRFFFTSNRVPRIGHPGRPS